MTVLPIYYVNAFSSLPFSGNPAAVVLLEEWLPDNTLITLASEINLPETAFLVGDHIRWFTPKIEVPLWTRNIGHCFCTKNDKTVP